MATGQLSRDDQQGVSDLPLKDTQVRNRKRAAALLLGGMLVLLALATRPSPVDGTGNLRECLDGTPFVFFDDGSTFYDASRRYLPVAIWPDGLAYDSDRDAVFDASGVVVVGLEERVAVTGIVVDTPGDPSPCYSTIGVKIDSLQRLP
jgi:hypothetical protein